MCIFYINDAKSLCTYCYKQETTVFSSCITRTEGQVGSIYDDYFVFAMETFNVISIFVRCARYADANSSSLAHTHTRIFDARRQHRLDNQQMYNSLCSRIPLLRPPLGPKKEKGLNWRMAVIEGVEIKEFKKDKEQSGILCVALTGGWLY